jgi:protein involved in polysaccharide export with SLBB domain
MKTTSALWQKILFALLASLLIFIGACAEMLPPKGEFALPPLIEETGSAQDSMDYLLQPGDVIDVKFYYNPELNEHITIRPDGKISLQLINEIRASGLSPSGLDSVLTEKYSKLLTNPEVTVIVRECAGYRVYIGGEVNAPGMFPLVGRQTVLRAILQAGGAKNTGELGSVVILRNQKTDKPLFITLNLAKDLMVPDRGNDIVLKPYDIVFVPKSIIAQLNQFVEQYFDKLIPVTKSFGIAYNISPAFF